MIWVIIIHCLLGLIAMNMAGNRGRNKTGGFIYGFIFGIIALICYGIAGDTDIKRAEKWKFYNEKNGCLTNKPKK